MNPNKSFLSVDEQINHLVSKGLTFDKGSFARKRLSSISYFSLINAYREPFLYGPRQGAFIRGTSFQEIYSLYFFDKRIRDAIFPYLLEAESLLKNKTVYTFLNAKKPDGEPLYPKDAYLSVASYDRTQRQNAFRCVIDFHKKISNNLAENGAIAHYFSSYSFVPLWVLETKMTFGDLWHFYQALPTNIRQEIAMAYKVKDDDLLRMMKIMTAGRNACAHRDRVYCMSHKYSMPALDQRHPAIHATVQSGNGNRNLFAVLLSLKVILPKSETKAVANIIKNESNELSKKLKTITTQSIFHKMGLPPDWHGVLIQ